jgi:hypothetical protein
MYPFSYVTWMVYTLQRIEGSIFGRLARCGRSSWPEWRIIQWRHLLCDLPPSDECSGILWVILNLILLQFRIVFVRENFLVATSAIVWLDINLLWHHQMKRSSSMSVSHNLRVRLAKSVCASHPIGDMDLSVEKQQNDYRGGVLALECQFYERTQMSWYTGTLLVNQYIFIVCSFSIEQSEYRTSNLMIQTHPRLSMGKLNLAAKQIRILGHVQFIFQCNFGRFRKNLTFIPSISAIQNECERIKNNGCKTIPSKCINDRTWIYLHNRSP